MVHASPTYPPPLLRLPLGSVEVTRPKEDLLRSHDQPQKNLWLNRVVASLCSALQLPLPSVPVGGWLSFLDSWRSMTGDFHVLQLLQHHLRLSFVSRPPLTTSLMPFPLPEQQDRASKHRDSLHVGEGGNRESVKQVVSRVLQFAVCHPQEEWEASLGNRPVVIELSPSEGEGSHGDARKSPAVQPEGRLGSLCGSDGCLPVHSDPPIVKKVSSFSLPGRCIPVSGSTFQLFSEPENLCSFLGLAGSPLPRQLASEEPASGAPQVTSRVFLDDWLLRNQQVEHLRSQAECLLLLAAHLGWIPSWEKLELTPTQDFVFIGTHNRTDLDWCFRQWFVSEKRPVTHFESFGRSMWELKSFSLCWVD